MWFDHFFTNATPTLPACTSLLSGLFPLSHRVLRRLGGRDLPGSAPWLPELLAERGWRTAAVDNLDDRKRWFTRGFDRYFNLRHRGDEYHSCFEINDTALRWLSTLGTEPFFLFLRYGDTHTPYRPPPAYSGLYGRPPEREEPLRALWRDGWRPYLLTHGAPGTLWSPTDDGNADLAWCRAQYDAEVRVADEGVSQLVDGLARAGLDQDTLLVVLGDHGESLGEHGVRCDHYGLYDCVIRPPLILRGAGVPTTGRRISALAQMPDLCPTVLDLLGLPAPAAVEGRSLGPVLREEAADSGYDRAVACECSWGFKWAMWKDRWKLIVSRAPDLLHRRAPLELYDLARDPEESVNLAGTDSALAGEWLGEFERWLARELRIRGLRRDPVRAEAALGQPRLRWRFFKDRLRWELALLGRGP